MREQGRSNTSIASLHHVKLSPMSAFGPTGEWQEHLDAIVSFARVGQRRRLFRELDIPTIKWATSDLPEECRFLLNTQLLFLKKYKDPTSKQFDDDEWFRSLTEAQEVTSDVPENSVTYEQQDFDSQKVRPLQMEDVLRKYMSRGVALSEGEIAALTTSMRQIGVGTAGGTEDLAIFHQLLFDERMTGCLSGPLATIKVDEKKLHRNDRIAGSARGGVAVSPQAHSSSSSVENIGTCLLLNKKGSRKCRRIGVQGKETSTARWSAACLSQQVAGSRHGWEWTIHQ